jgi:hypothetical protein
MWLFQHGANALLQMLFWRFSLLKHSALLSPGGTSNGDLEKGQESALNGFWHCVIIIIITNTTISADHPEKVKSL